MVRGKPCSPKDALGRRCGVQSGAPLMALCSVQFHWGVQAGKAGVAIQFPFLSCSHPGFCMAGEGAGLLKDMIQTVPDPAAHTEVSSVMAGRWSSFSLSCAVMATVFVSTNMGSRQLSQGRLQPTGC